MKCFIFRVCVCSLRYPTCKAHASYRHLWLVWVYHIFTHYLINGKIFGKKHYWTPNVCFDFLCKFISYVSHSNRYWAWYYHKCHRTSWKYPLFFSDFMELKFVDRLSKNTQISNFIKISLVEAKLFRADGQTEYRQTDRHEDANGRLSQFCIRSQNFLYHFSVCNYILS